jgi:hypothetical protein
VNGLGAAAAYNFVAIVVVVLALAFFAAVSSATGLALARRVVIVEGFGADRARREEHDGRPPIDLRFD